MNNDQCGGSEDGFVPLRCRAHLVSYFKFKIETYRVMGPSQSAFSYKEFFAHRYEISETKQTDSFVFCLQQVE